MRKTNLIIAVIGLVSCVAMSMMMSHLLSMNPDQKAMGPIVTRFEERFGAMLDVTPRFTVRPVGLPSSPRIAVTVHVQPKVTARVDELVRSMGSFLWKGDYKGGALRSLLIEVTDPVTKQTVGYPIADPGRWRRRRGRRLPGPIPRGSAGRSRPTRTGKAAGAGGMKPGNLSSKR
ncbi:MAG: hypothetical protein ACE5F1_04200 [Planctomycetota bacterium]